MLGLLLPLELPLQDYLAKQSKFVSLQPEASSMKQRPQLHATQGR